VPAPRRKSRPSRLRAVVPAGAVVYDPSGKTYVFTSPEALKYTEVPITIDHFAGNSAYLRAGPRPGTAVVTVGAEELLGVQTGVLAQT
jgi:multidrug efflux pump subunit AcrA (membrane-fusion protein)